jgi:hypothetical protein
VLIAPTFVPTFRLSDSRSTLTFCPRLDFIIAVPLTGDIVRPQSAGGIPRSWFGVLTFQITL